MKSGGSTRGTPPDASRVRRAFVTAWVVIGVVVASTLIAVQTHPSTPLAAGSGQSGVPPIPAGTNLTFVFSEALPIYQQNVSGQPGSPPVDVVITGNWTSTAPTWVGVNLGGPGPSPCLLPFACPGAGNSSGPLHLAVEVPTDPTVLPGTSSVRLYLEFWAEGSDTVTVTSPLSAAAVA